jgi:probable F420-dependent oxidoreductase
MKIGVIFPQTEIGRDPVGIRIFAQQVENFGFNHILTYEHVLGANPDRSDKLRGPYSYQHSFHSPFLLFSYMAAVTTTLEFVTGIIILPQRQTALVAKQAATLDVLCGGRLRLGIGIGWNHVEYIALNQDYHTRGKRVEEQIPLMRQLWTQPLVTFKGDWHHIPDAGINPLPVQRPIPIWIGGNADAVLKRTARMGDGWMPNYRTVEQIKPALEKLRRYLEEAGRSQDGFGLEPRMYYKEGDPDTWAVELESWRELGATHLSINTMGCGFDTVQEHLNALRRFAELMGIT